MVLAGIYKSEWIVDNCNGLTNVLCQVIHSCHTLQDAKTEIPALLRGESIIPTSDLSTIDPSNPSTIRIPKAVVIGKGFSQSEMDEIVQAGDAVAKGKVAWLLPDDEKFTAYMKAKAILSVGTMLPTVIADRVKMCLDEHGIKPGKEESFEAGVWGF